MQNIINLYVENSPPEEMQTDTVGHFYHYFQRKMSTFCAAYGLFVVFLHMYIFIDIIYKEKKRYMFYIYKEYMYMFYILI